MATFSFTLAYHTKRNGKQSIRLRVTENRTPVFKPTGFEIEAKHWDGKKERVKVSYPNAAVINNALNTQLLEAEAAYAELVSKGTKTNARQIISRTNGVDFYKFADSVINKVKSPAKRERYGIAIGHLKNFIPSLTTRDLTAETIENFREYLKEPATGKKPLKKGTVTNYLTTIKFVCGKHPYLKKNNPFDEVVIGAVAPVRYRKDGKDWLTREEVELLHRYIPAGKWQQLAKDMFLTSFYCAGMRFKDVMLLKWTDIKNGRVEFEPYKTAESSGVTLSMPLHDRVKAILAGYDRSTFTVFDVLKTDEPNEVHRLLKSLRGYINDPLSGIIKSLGINKHITMHCARKTFAMIARPLTDDLTIIRDAVGHTKTSTTEDWYLDKDQQRIDDLLRKVYG